MNILLRKARSGLVRVRRVLVSQRFGFDPANIYGQAFYEDGGFSKTAHSADVISTWMLHNLAPKSVLDLGSGAGHYLRAFAANGVQALGLEASPGGVAASGQEVLALTYDLRRAVHLSRRFDIVMCIEVAEHLPTRSSATLVASICRNAAKFAVFTAAPPGTPGTDHINCQLEAFWVSLFRERGFFLRSDLTADLRRTAAEQDAAQWWQSWAWCFESGGEAGASAASLGNGTR
jgi:SAM-dependent methyltransferase